MTPVKPFHSRVAQRLAVFLEAALGGEAFTELAIVLPAGLRGPDVAWASRVFLSAHADEFKPGSPALRTPPELCIEVMSDSNSYGEIKEKVDAYLTAGAREAWIVATDLRVSFFDARGEKPATDFAVDLSSWTVG